VIRSPQPRHQSAVSVGYFDDLPRRWRGSLTASSGGRPGALGSSVGDSPLRAIADPPRGFSVGMMEMEHMHPTLHLGDRQVDGPSLAEVCRRYGVKEPSLFGSSVRGEMRPESDIDIMV
jgi:hypothetical protein